MEENNTDIDTSEVIENYELSDEYFFETIVLLEQLPKAKKVVIVLMIEAFLKESQIEK